MDNLYKMTEVLTNTIYSDLQHLCSEYNIPFEKVVKIGRASELVKFALCNGFLGDEKTFLDSLPLMCDTEHIFFTASKGHPPMLQQLLFVKADAVFFYAACAGLDNFEKVKECLALKTRINFATVYSNKRIYYDKTFANEITQSLDDEDTIMADVVHDAGTDTCENKCSLLYDKSNMVSKILDSVGVTREEYVRCGRLSDEITHNGGKVNESRNIGKEE